MTDTSVANLTVDEFVTSLAAKSPVPGGGAASASVLAHSAALGSMVISYTLGKPKFAEFQARLEKLDLIFTNARVDALELADRDSSAYLALNALWKIPAEARVLRPDWHSAVAEAIASPSAIADLAMGVLAALSTMSSITSAQLASDLKIAQLFAHAALEGALLNVAVNLPQVEDLAMRASFENFVAVRRVEGARLVAKPSVR